MYDQGYLDAIGQLGLVMTKTANPAALVKYIPQAMAATAKAAKPGMSLGKKIGLGVAGTAAVGGLGYAATRNGAQPAQQQIQGQGQQQYPVQGQQGPYPKTAASVAIGKHVPKDLAKLPAGWSRKKLMAALGIGAAGTAAVGGGAYAATRKDEKQEGN